MKRTVGGYMGQMPGYIIWLEQGSIPKGVPRVEVSWEVPEERVHICDRPRSVLLRYDEGIERWLLGSHTVYFCPFCGEKLI